MRYFIVISIAVILFAAQGCKVEDDFIPDQRGYFESYLGRIMEEGETYEYQDGIYKFILENTAGEDDNPEPVVKGDSMEIYFDIHTFSSSGPSALPFYSNRQTTIDEIYSSLGLVNAGEEDGSGVDINGNAFHLGALDWPTDVLKIKLGATRLMKGLERGLPGSHMGDSLLLFVISDLAYGNEVIPGVGQNTPVMFRIKVVKAVQQ